MVDKENKMDATQSVCGLAIGGFVFFFDLPIILNL